MISNTLLQKIQDISRLVGNTPLVSLDSMSPKNSVKISAKIEWYNLGASIKVRPVLEMIKQGIQQDVIRHGSHIIEATSGNTGIAYAAICTPLGLKLTIVMPENASKIKKQILKKYGANLVYSSPLEGTDGAQEMVREIMEKNIDQYVYLDQYSNENNWKSHYLHTAEEIWTQTEGRITHFVAGIGTSGTFVGIAKKLKEKDKNIKCIALQPDNPLHILEGWKHLKTAKVPKIFNSNNIDEWIEIPSELAAQVMEKTIQTEGLFVSYSSAGNIAGCIKAAGKIDGDGYVVTVLPDNLDKYLE